jgi:ubiquinone/menaquinone biosynthesis C-methylase UbiE
MAPFDHFDFAAPYYDRFIKPRDISRFVHMVNLPTVGILLDVGGGTGQKSLPLLSMAGGLIIVDSSMGMLAQAKQKNGLVTICTAAELLPFSDETIDRVIMVDALHHVLNYQTTASEMWRVTKPGGRIVIEEPDIRKTPIKMLAIIEKILLMRSHFVSPQGIAACFNHPNAKVSIETDDATAWIIIDKQAE